MVWPESIHSCVISSVTIHDCLFEFGGLRFHFARTSLTNHIKVWCNIIKLEKTLLFLDCASSLHIKDQSFGDLL